MHPSWKQALSSEFQKDYFRNLSTFVEQDRKQHTVYPPSGLVFNVLSLTPYEEARVLILGQDPYHGPGQAHGLSFSVQPGMRVPPSLANIYTELQSDLNFVRPKHGYLLRWAQQGVLLLNAVLTVREASPGSHRDHGWETFTDAVIQKLNEKPHVVFVLWGAYAKAKASLIDPRHTVLTSAHPSPLAAHNGFFGSRPFSKVNAALDVHGQHPIDWQLPMTAEV